jgi:hypothetical protein
VGEAGRKGIDFLFPCPGAGFRFPVAERQQRGG